MKTILVAVAMLVAPALAQGQNPPAKAYTDAYRLIREAKHAEYMGQKDLAWQRYREAQTSLKAIRDAYPTWNAAGMEAQARLCAEGITKNAPVILASLEEMLTQVKGSAGKVGQLQERKVALQVEVEWQRKELLNIERLMTLFAKKEEARRILGKPKGAPITEEDMRLAEAPGAKRTPEAEEEKVDEKLDSDNDGLTDAEEEKLGTDPNKADTDGDGLSDGDEVNVYHTDPLDKDTDGDGYDDGTEVEAGTDPNDPNSHPYD